MSSAIYAAVTMKVIEGSKCQKINNSVYATEVAYAMVCSEYR
jgi:hypothetical protein